MMIPETQLETWSRQGAAATAKATHESIRKALLVSGLPLLDKDTDIYLQGSYRNDTNIRGDSDVDLVVQLNSTFQRELVALPQDELARYRATFIPATYHLDNFRADVLHLLRDYYGASAVREGNKCLKVSGGSGRLPADVVVCLQYRSYRRFRSLQDQRFIEGIAFYTRNEERLVINYPKEHYENGVIKNNTGHTNGWFKPTVRLFKNARSHLIDCKALAEDGAPSYFLQCLLYNVPDDEFGVSYQQTFVNVVNWLYTADFTSFVCENEQLPLFGSTPEQWSIPVAKQFVAAIADLWNNW